MNKTLMFVHDVDSIELKNILPTPGTVTETKTFSRSLVIKQGDSHTTLAFYSSNPCCLEVLIGTE